MHQTNFVVNNFCPHHKIKKFSQKNFLLVRPNRFSKKYKKTGLLKKYIKKKIGQNQLVIPRHRWQKMKLCPIEANHSLNGFDRKND